MWQKTGVQGNRGRQIGHEGIWAWQELWGTGQLGQANGAGPECGQTRREETDGEGERDDKTRRGLAGTTGWEEGLENECLA